MVKAIIDIDKEANRVLNILKAEYGLRDKSQAINKLAKDFANIILESQMRSQYLKRLKIIEKGKFLSKKELEKELGVKI